MDYKYLGTLDSNIAEYWGLEEHKNKPIIVYDNRKQHVIERHLKDFGSIEEIDYSYNSLSSIIKNPDYTFYNENSHGLEYYKKLKNNLCVAVRINKGKTLKVRSWYPANNGKIANRKKKEEAEKEVIAS